MHWALRCDGACSLMRVLDVLSHRLLYKTQCAGVLDWLLLPVVLLCFVLLSAVLLKHRVRMLAITLSGGNPVTAVLLAGAGSRAFEYTDLVAGRSRRPDEEVAKGLMQDFTEAEAAINKSMAESAAVTQELRAKADMLLAGMHGTTETAQYLVSQKTCFDFYLHSH